ncbi:MAG: hypothetical protein IJF16_03435, partial [Clostridia bacterium]|nr:hypothetical protein [Clostridia bacterium]
QYCSSITADTVLSEGYELPATPVATITYTKNSGALSVIEFYEYEKDFYAMSVNGDTFFGVRKEKVQDIADAVELYRNGKLRRYAASITMSPDEVN